MAGLFPALGVVVAALGGAAIGVERQWSGHAAGTHPHLGGVRTFTLIGGAAGLAGVVATAGYAAVAATVVTGLVAVIVLGYLAASRTHIDATTEVAAIVVVVTGFLAGIGWIQLSSGAVAITALLLIEKSRLHAFVERIDDEELRAAVRFAVMAVVVLPILPEGPLERFGGIRPRELWLFVLFFSGISFIGYLARRAVGSFDHARHKGVRLVHYRHACSHGRRDGSGVGDCTVKLEVGRGARRDRRAKLISANSAVKFAYCACGCRS